MEQKNSHYCSCCGKKLRVFTVDLDWNKRMLHKSCWKKNRDEILMCEMDIEQETYKEKCKEEYKLFIKKQIEKHKSLQANRNENIMDIIQRIKNEN